MDGDQLRKRGVVRRPTVTSRFVGDVFPRRLRHVTRSRRHGICRPTALYDRAVNHRGMQQWERNPRIAFHSSPVPSEQQGAVTPSSSSGWASTRGSAPELQTASQNLGDQRPRVLEFPVFASQDASHPIYTGENSRRHHSTEHRTCCAKMQPQES